MIKCVYTNVYNRNVDFADIRNIMKDGGRATMGVGEVTAEASEARSIRAVELALHNPLLEDISLKQAKGVIINVVGGKLLIKY